MRNLTIRNVPDDLGEALDKEKNRRNVSLNRTVIDVLSQSLGVGLPRSNGLARLAGTWTAEDLRTFEENIAPFEMIDDEIWR
jgi:plasmid stability protein